MSTSEDTIRLRHMLDATGKAMEFTSGLACDAFERDEMLALSVVRLLEILGEAAKNVSKDCRLKYPAIPWRQIAGTRDRLIHGYFEVDYEVVWEIISQDLPGLASQLENILNDTPR